MPRGRARLALAVIAVATLAAGCSIINALVTTRTSLSNAGWNVVSTNIRSGAGYGPDGALLVGVDYRSSLDETVPQQAAAVAKVVWENTPGRFSSLHVTVEKAAVAGAGRTGFVYSHSSLATALGRRPANLDANPLVDLAGLGRDIAIGAISALVAIILVTILVVWLFSRYRRRRSGGSPGGGAVGGFPRQGYGYPTPPPSGATSPEQGG